MPLLVSVSDILPDDEMAEELEKMGAQLGVMNMCQAYLLVEPWLNSDGVKVVFVVTEENHSDMIRLFYAMAVFNFACMIHEHFSVLSIEEGMAINLSRTHTVEQHLQTVEQMLLNIRSLIRKYGPGYFNGS